jgi:hypothetical protein
VNVPTLLHVTAHDGHMRESPRSEVGDHVATELRYLLALACALHAAPVGIGVPGWVMTAQERPGSLSVQIYGPNGLLSLRPVPSTTHRWAGMTPGAVWSAHPRGSSMVSRLTHRPWPTHHNPRG